jgi:hypothetical protein
MHVNRIDFDGKKGARFLIRVAMRPGLGTWHLLKHSFKLNVTTFPSGCGSKYIEIEC